MNRVLRHDDWLQVSLIGFAWIEDLLAAVAFRPYRLQCFKDDIYCVVAKEKPGRLQIVSKDGSMGDYTVIVRCFQGHSKKGPGADA